jgi:hypothetical protein
MSAPGEFPVSRCGPCDRDVLTHVRLDACGTEHRLCYHCDAEMEPGAVRWVPEAALAALGYGFHGDDGGCGRPGCGRGNCANRT